MTCQSCQHDNHAGARFCGHCGAALAAAPPRPDPGVRQPGGAVGGYAGAAVARAPTGKNPTLAVILSILIPGVGQLYNDDTKKGLVMLIGGFFVVLITFGLAWLPIVIWSAIDAYQVAEGSGKRWA